LTVSDWFRPPAPVAVAEHGVCAVPSYENGPAEQLTVVVLDALSMVNVFESLLLLWFASPLYAAKAVAVPAFTLFV